MIRTLLPYKVVAQPKQIAHIIDRATGEQVGYVRAAYWGWEAYRANGTPIPFGATRWGDPIRVTRYRSDAASAVWKAARG